MGTNNESPFRRVTESNDNQDQSHKSRHRRFFSTLRQLKLYLTLLPRATVYSSANRRLCIRPRWRHHFVPVPPMDMSPWPHVVLNDKINRPIFRLMPDQHREMTSKVFETGPFGAHFTRKKQRRYWPFHLTKFNETQPVHGPTDCASKRRIEISL